MLLCKAQGFAGPSGCVLERGHNGAHKYGDIAVAEADQLRIDAARYRWLRECSSVRSDRTMYVKMAMYHEGQYLGSDNISGADLDSAIDAAMRPN